MVGMIVVAAGYGTLRSKNGRPVSKLMERIHGQPMFMHALRRANIVGIREIVIVANPMYVDEFKDAVRRAIDVDFIRNQPVFVSQQNRHGAADAVSYAIPSLVGRGIRRALITYGDMPEWSANTFRTLLCEDDAREVVTMVTAERSLRYPALDRYGRILRNAHGHIARVMEVDDPQMTDDVYDIHSVNPSLWIWDLAWLQKMIPLIPPFQKKDGHGDELHMPRLIGMATSEGRHIQEVALSCAQSREALGVKTAEELDALVRRFVCS